MGATFQVKAVYGRALYNRWDFHVGVSMKLFFAFTLAVKGGRSGGTAGNSPVSFLGSF